MAPRKKGTKRKASTRVENRSSDDSAIERAFQHAFYSDTSSSDEETLRGRINKNGRLRRKKGHKPKRPKTSEPLANEMSDGEHIMDDLHRAETVAEVVRTVTLPVEFTATLNGPQISINIANIVANSNLLSSTRARLVGSNAAATAINLEEQVQEGHKWASFNDLPPEISLRILRSLLVTPDRPIMFTDRYNLQHSAQLLRAGSRKIYEEGTAVLYGENSFHFARCHKARGAYFEPAWKEVGYKDVRRFFHDIGPQNMAKLRYVSIEFDDAVPTFTPNHTAEGRKYFNDAVLIEVVKMLAKNTRLEKLAIGFHGCRGLTTRDYHFLRALCTIRCHELVEDRKHGMSRIAGGLFGVIKGLIQLPTNDNDKLDKSKNKLIPRMFQDRLGAPSSAPA